MAAQGHVRTHDRSRYEGRNLFRLLLALGIPAFLLYLRIVFAIAATRTGIAPEPRTWLLRGSYIVLAVFLVVQVLCARYVQRLLRPMRTRVGKALQYAGVFAVCLFLSFSGAIACESFGYAVLVRVARDRQ